MRGLCALELQPYRFRIIVIKGSENIGADSLSLHIVSDVSELSM